MTWADKTLREFQDALASDAPTPGGGSAVGVALGQAAALAIMVSDLTLSKETYESGWEIANQVRAVATPLLDEGLTLAIEDSESFDAVVEAFRLPKSTDEEKNVRRDSIRTGAANRNHEAENNVTLQSIILQTRSRVGDSVEK